LILHQKKVVLRKEHGAECWVFFYGEAGGRRPHVTEAQAKRRMARGGKLDINIDYVKLVSGEKAVLRAVKDVKGGGHTGGIVGGW
jgi:hypothetical protein